MAQVLLGRLGSQEDVELALQPSIVEVGELAASGGVGLRRMRPQLLEPLNDRAKAGGVEGLNNDGCPRQLSLRHDDEVQVPKA